MKTKEENKQSKNAVKNSAERSGEKLFSLMMSYPSASPSLVITPSPDGQQNTLNSPEYNNEEDGSQDSLEMGEISTGEDGGEALPSGNPSGSEGGGGEEGGGEDGSIKLGSGNYAKGKQKKADDTAAGLQKKSTEVDAKNKIDVQDQEGRIQEGEEGSEELGTEKKGKNQEEEKDHKQKQDDKKARLESENRKLNEQQGETPSAPPSAPPASASPQPSQEPSAPTQQNEGGSGAGQNFVVNQQNAQLFSGGQIIKQTEQGNAVVFSEGGLSEEQSSVAQPLPQSIIQEELDKRKQENSASAAVFQAESQTQIIQVKTKTDHQQTKLNIKQTLALAEIEVASNQAVQKVDSDIAAAKDEITSKFDGFKESLQTHSQTVIESINSKKTEELANIDSELSKAIEASLQLQETTINSANNSIDTQVQRIKDEAIRMGDLAIQIANTQADAERSKPVKEQSRWEKIKNGGDYEENKKKARVDACVEVGKQTKKQFQENAESAAAELLSSKAAIQEEIKANIVQLNDAFTSQAEDTKTALSDQADGHIQQVQTETETLIAELESKKASELSALDSFGSTKKSEIQTLSAQLKSQLQQQASSAKQQLEETSSSSISQLSGAQSELMNQLKSSLEMDVADFSKLQGTVTQQFQSAAQSIGNSIDEQGNSSAESLGAFGAQAVEQITQMSTATSEAITSQKDQAIATGEGIKANGMSSLDQLKTSAEADLTSIRESLASFFTEKISEFTTKFGEVATKIDEDLVSKADEVIAGFQAELDKLPQVLEQKANEAEAAVKPRWRKIVGVLIEIVAAVALAAVVALLVASGVGIVGLLIGGLIAGALIGAGKQMLNNALDGKPLTEGVGKAMAVGAVEGVFAALTGGAGAQIMSKVGGKLTSMGAGQLVSATSKFGQRAVGKFAVEALASISEGAATTVVGNLMDGKAWNEGLMQSVASGAIDSVVGLGTNKITGGVGSSNALGNQVGESLSRRAGREVVEMGVDFAGNSISSGAQNVITNWDKIQSGEAGMMDSFGEGVSNDWETNLVKSGTRNAAGAVTNSILDNGATRRLQQEGVDAPELGDGYNYTINDQGEVDVRKTHELGAGGEALPDLSYNAQDNRVFDPAAPAAQPIAGDPGEGQQQLPVSSSPAPEGERGDDGANRVVQSGDPATGGDDSSGPTAVPAIPLAAQQGNGQQQPPDQGGPDRQPESGGSGHDGGDNSGGNRTGGNNSGGDDGGDDGNDFVNRSNNDRDPDDGDGNDGTPEVQTTSTTQQGTTSQGGDSDLSPSAQEAQNRGLPQAPDGYYYNTTASGELIISRKRKFDAEGNENARLAIDGNQIVREGLTADHTQTFDSPDALAATYDPKGRMSSADRGMIYNYYQQGKWDKIEEILNTNAPDNAGTVWPPARGGYNTQNDQPIADGAVFDRYGTVRYDSDGNIIMENGLPQLTGTFTSPMDENGNPYPFDSRALDKEREQYDVYYEIVVTGDIDITSNNSSVIPWFGKEGDGTQAEWNVPRDPDTGYPLTWNQLQEMGLIEIRLKDSPSGAVDVDAINGVDPDPASTTTTSRSLEDDQTQETDNQNTAISEGSDLKEGEKVESVDREIVENSEILSLASSQNAEFSEDLANIARLSHNTLLKDGKSPRGFNNSTVAIAEVEIDGETVLFASGNGASLSPAQRAKLVELGVPEENIFSGKAFKEFIDGDRGEQTKLANHAERVIERNLPSNAVIKKWGISWASKQKNEMCDNCKDHFNVHD